MRPISHLATPFESHIADLGGTPTKFREKIIAMYSIYSKSLTEVNYRAHLECLTGEVAVYEGFVQIANVDQTLFYPKTLGELISLCNSLNIDLYWDSNTYKEFIYYNSKY